MLLAVGLATWVLFGEWGCGTSGRDGVIDPAAYLGRLPRLVDDLPAAVAVFATDPQRYDFAGLRCVKDAHD